MPDRQERQFERDQDFIKKLVVGAGNLRMSLREWIQEEVLDLAPELDILAASTSGVIQKRFESAKQRVSQIHDQELLRAIQQYRELIDTLEAMPYANPFDCHRRLNDGLDTLREMVRELIEIRQFAAGFSGTAHSPNDGDDDANPASRL